MGKMVGEMHELRRQMRRTAVQLRGRTIKLALLTRTARERAGLERGIQEKLDRLHQQVSKLRPVLRQQRRGVVLRLVRQAIRERELMRSLKLRYQDLDKHRRERIKKLKKTMP
jgi:hypothetical protein